MTRVLNIIAMLLYAPMPLFAQSVFTGTWQAESTPPWTVVLKADGTPPTGRVSQCSSQVSQEIYDARVDGNSITFKCKSGDGDRTVTLTGTLKGNEIAFTWHLDVRSGGAPVDPNPRGREGILGPSSPPEFVVRRVPDGPLAAQADRLQGAEFAAAVNLIDRDVKALGVLFVPVKVVRIRGAIVVIQWGRGFEMYDDVELRRLAQTLSFGLLRVAIYHVSEPDASLIGPGRMPAPDSAEALTLILRRFAAESGHQELAGVPIVLWGHSAAGGEVSGLSALLPSRTIAFVRYHSGPVANGDMTVLAHIPGLILVGAQDAGNSVEASTLWKNGRSIAAPWTFGVEPNATHDDVSELRKANELLIPWITAVVRLRLSTDGQSLRRVQEDSAWMGNNRTGNIAPFGRFAGSKTEASWLPDEISAQAWRHVLGFGQ